MNRKLNIAFFGSSLVSAHRNGAATYYRGIIKGLAAQGHHITYYEPDAYERQEHRDIPDPEWARVAVYSSRDESGVVKALESARGAHLVVKASGIGAFDELLERAVLEIKAPDTRVAFWDVAPSATIDRVEANPADPFAALIPRYDLIFTYGGGNSVVQAYKRLGARACIPIYNALDPAAHYRSAGHRHFEADLAFLGDRLPEQEARVEEFFLRPATALRDRRFLLAGNGWQDKDLASNIKYVGQIHPRDHNAFNSTPLAVLSINRPTMGRHGFAPPTRVFEAAGARSCVITDYWKGIEMFLDPGSEVLVARSGEEVADHLRFLTPIRAKTIGQAAYARVLAEHTYAHRAAQVEAVLWAWADLGVSPRILRAASGARVA